MQSGCTKRETVIVYNHRKSKNKRASGALCTQESVVGLPDR